ncbi:hypothetical protein PMZ80_004362 [Knufia obscura]|uniref:Synembryn-A n=2 Tax=Knufia TaxID=430999 RepID=A0AAN8ECL3_9EURO|nr:hypothetical protein PMZ80_004362 [Knufia obscura]KAK5948158.1 hypothetical protein OHC33_010811 [Knufia fluminis]
MPGPSEKAQEDLDFVRAELQNDSFEDAQVGRRLTSLKLIAREPEKASCVYCRDGLTVLAEAAFGRKNAQRPISSLEAARIIANALLLRDQMQQVLADLGYTERIVDFYNQRTADHEFVGARILFLLTYKSKVDFVALIESHLLLDHIGAQLLRHASSLSSSSFASSPMNAMALVETLKLLYNLASKFPGQMHFFSKTVSSLINIVSTISIPSGPLDPPIAQLLNDLAIIEWPTPSNQNEEEIMLGFTERMIDLLDRSTSSLRAAQLETMLIAPITVTRKLNELHYTKVKQLLRLSLLPQDEERDKPLGHSQSLASRMLRLQTSGGLTILPEAISSLLFDLSDHDATKFVHNIGYGHAAGHLMTHKIPIPQGLETANGSGAGNGEVQINPVTGQRLDAETPVSMPEMTDKEKEREAERLFVLFEKLKATGVMNVENPLRTAQESGRFEELSDSDPD